MAFIESKWDLRCESSPRSVAIAAAPSVPSQTSSQSKGSGSTARPTSMHTGTPAAGQSRMQQQAGATSSQNIPPSTNPFDAVFDSTTKMTPATIPGTTSKHLRTGHTNQFSHVPSQSLPLSSGFKVLIGTENGTIHHRIFPKIESQHINRNAFASTDSTVQPKGLDGTSSDRVHPLHRPLDSDILSGDGRSFFPIIACVSATPSFENAETWTKRSPSTSRTSVYLLLQHDERMSSKPNFASGTETNRNFSSDESEGTYAAHLISINHITNSVQKVYSSTQLPRMSCATYHPACGFVYAAGNSIYSLPSTAVRAVCSILSENSDLNIKTETNASNSVEEEIGLRDDDPTIYYKANQILPGDVRSGVDSIASACDGRVMIAAVGNSFYAVSGSTIPHGTWQINEEAESAVMPKDEHGADSLSSLQQRHGSNETYRLEVNDKDGGAEDSVDMKKAHDLERVLKFRQSSQVHPAIIVDVPMVRDAEIENGYDVKDIALDDEAFTSLLFLASGRECAVVEILYNPRLYSNSGNQRPNEINEPEDRLLLPSASISCGSIVVGSPRRGIATIASPILAAVGIQSTSQRSGPLLALLTNDGLVHTRSPSCIAIPLSTIEVGTRPNDFFSLRSLPNRNIVAISYSGEGRLISLREDTVQDLADRMMKLSINAFGSSGFPRSEFADAVDAKFSATSYVGPEPTNSAKTILRQYLEMILGLDIHGDFGGGDTTSWFFNDILEDEKNCDADNTKFRQVVRSTYASTFVSATALLCLLCIHLKPGNSSLAIRASKSCTSRMGVVSSVKNSGISLSSVQLCKQIVNQLLIAAELNSGGDQYVTNVDTRTLAHMNGTRNIEFVEAAIYLLRSCGEHEHAIDVYQNIMSNSTTSNKPTEILSNTPTRRGWSQKKSHSFMATYLGDLWSHGDHSCKELILSSSATRRVLESSPMLGLGIFTALHPNNRGEWNTIASGGDPIDQDFPHIFKQVLELLKSIRPLVPHDKRTSSVQNDTSSYQIFNNSELPLESGLALAATYLESLIGISTQKPPTKEPLEGSHQGGTTAVQNELALLLLEGVLSERGDNEAEGDSSLGTIYRSKLRRLLGWYNASVSPDILMSALPSSFLRERALLLGQLGRHEDALHIFYDQLGSLDLALEYCDARFEKQHIHLRADLCKRSGDGNKRQSLRMDCPYLPLVTVALKTDDSEGGISSAIRILSLRRENIDRTSALQLLPPHIPISALSKSFLIPALIDSESEARRMTIVASLLRAKYVHLRHTLTDSQIKSQSSVHTVPGLKAFNLGDPVYSSKLFKVRPSSSVGAHFPEISIIKHFFQRHVLLQMIVTNTAVDQSRTLGEVRLIVAESSDDALIQSTNIPIKTLPPKRTGSAWCVLAASSQRLDGSATLTCEMRYNILDIDSATGAPLNFGTGFGRNKRSFVEEIQDIEIRKAEFDAVSKPERIS